MNDEKKKISLQASYQIDSQFDSRRFVKMRLKICHTGVNLNRSIFTLDGFEKARSSLANIPILANVLSDEEGEPKFGAHDRAIEEDYKGDLRLVYKELPIGMIPETCNYSLEEDNGRFYVTADGYIWRDYANYAEDIVEKEGSVPLSMEIDLIDYDYLSDKDEWVIKDYLYRGVTFLGNDVLPAMEGANATVYSKTASDFAMIFEKMQEALLSELDESKQANQSEEAKEMENKEHDSAVQTSDGQTTEENFGAENENVTPEEPATNEFTQAENEQKPEEDFALVSSIVSQLNGALRSYTMDFDGFEVQKYYFEDIDVQKQTLYVYSMADANVYATPYMVENDAVSIVPNFRKQVVSYRDFVEGQDELCDFEATTPVHVEKYQELKSSLEAAEAKVTELTEFKTNVEAEKKAAEAEEILGEFTDLAGVEEFETLKSKALEYSAEDLKKECFAIRGKQHTPKQEKFNYNKSNTSNAKFNLPFDHTEGTSSRIGDMINHYSKKGMKG